MCTDIAAWVQAVGTILAIGAGFAYHAWQANLALRQKIQLALDALNEINTEVQKAQDGTRSDFPDFDTSRLHLVAHCLEPHVGGAGATLEVQLAILSIHESLCRYIAQWDLDTGKATITDSIAHGMDIMDLDGNFETPINSACSALTNNLRRLRRNPFSMH